MLAQSGQIADSVPVGVGERAQVDLVDNASRHQARSVEGPEDEARATVVCLSVRVVVEGPGPRANDLRRPRSGRR